MTPVPTPSVTPVFASDEEALAAADESYRRYIAISDELSAAGWTQPELLAEYVTPDEFDRTVVRYAKLSASGNHTSGSAAVDNVTLQRYDAYEIVVYLCVDVSAVRVLDASEKDVTPDDRPDRVPLEVGFVVGEERHLLLDSSEVWDEGNVCEP